jgi:acetolactate synthase-1/2/3 large subunit
MRTRRKAVDEAQSPRAYAATTVTEGEAEVLRWKIAGAKQPLALIGRGALMRGAPAAVTAFIAGWQIPFFATYKAKGIVDEHDPLCLGSVGLSPVVDALNLKAIAEADLLLLIGFDPIELRDAWVDAWPWSMPCITLDWAPTNDRIFPRGSEAYGSLDLLLRQLSPDTETPARSALRIAIARIAAQCGCRCRAARAMARARSARPGCSTRSIAGSADDWIMTVDVGAHRILANHVLRCRTPGQLLQSNGPRLHGLRVAGGDRRAARPSAASGRRDAGRRMHADDAG